MNDKVETVADIVADLRQEASDCPDIGRAGIYDRYADRIEAAWKRETSKNASKNGADFGQLGNAAAMRKALGKIRAELWNNAVIAGKKKFELYEIADVALAKPSRNCDRFGGDIEKLREACLRERGLNPEENFPDVFPDWLLAPSTEWKGGAS